MSQDNIKEIIKSYSNIIVQVYCWIRFKILREHFLDDIGQYLPSNGSTLDVGCGFGLFSLFYAMRFPQNNIFGIDKNCLRIELAKKSAEKLSLTNVHYACSDAVLLEPDRTFNAIYMLDIVHHIPRDAVAPLLKTLYASLENGGRLIIKDVDRVPAYKYWFTFLLDKMMDMKAELNYWHKKDIVSLLKQIGFEVYVHTMTDILPYPHLMYVCRKI